MKLYEILNNNINISNNTDKHTTHNYIDGFYEKEMAPFKNTAKTILEIGIGWGGSIALWRKYFESSTIIALDVNEGLCRGEFKSLEGVVYKWGNSYDNSVVDSLPEFDIGIDDGPHTLESMIFFVSQYSKKVSSGGMLVVEDVQDYSWFEELQKYVPSNFQSEIIDLRKSKNRYDDMMFVLRRID